MTINRFAFTAGRMAYLDSVGYTPLFAAKEFLTVNEEITNSFTLGFEYQATMSELTQQRRALEIWHGPTVKLWHPLWGYYRMWHWHV